MESIDPAQHSLVQQPSQDKKKIEKKGRTGGVFGSLLESRKSEFLDFFRSDAGASLEELLDAVHIEGERLAEKPVYSQIVSYKKAVGDFLRYVISNGLELKAVEGTRLSIFKKQKKYIIIHSINERLDRLAAGILQNQLKQLDILARVEEIQGLVVDLLS
ncbi:MAG: YaaR family protein [Spirochaetales bacterium]|nr:YaaR family protein [Spirochaetales bacterium]